MGNFCIFDNNIFSKPYNLERIKIFQMIGLFINTWGISFSVLYVQSGENRLFIILGYSGIATIFILGLPIIRRLPKGFKDQQGISIKSLVKFQFSKNKNVLFGDSIFQRVNDINIKFDKD